VNDGGMHFSVQWRKEGCLPRQICLEARSDVHDILLWREHLLAVSTGTNEVLVLDPSGQTTGRFQFPGDGDAWHLNCLAHWKGTIVVSAFGSFRASREYKDQTKGRGIIVDLFSKEILWGQLSQPHSPLPVGDTLYVCDSETCRVLWRRGTSEGQMRFDAYTRGLAVAGNYLFVGLSVSRNLPSVSERRTASIEVINLQTGARVATQTLPFKEIYAIAPLGGTAIDDLLQCVEIAAQDRDRIAQDKLALEAQLSQSRQELESMVRQASDARTSLVRLHRHPLLGPAIRILRRMKSDPGFGRIDS